MKKSLTHGFKYLSLALMSCLLLAGVSHAKILIYDSGDAVFGDFALNDGKNFSFSNLAAHSEIYLHFDLYVMDSWDGNYHIHGPDTLKLVIDNVAKAQWTFNNFSPNVPGFETNMDVADETGNFNNVNYWGPIDRLFENYGGGFTFGHTADSLDVGFAVVESLQGLTDESWRLQNVKIFSNAENGQQPIPEPTTMLLFGTGLAGLAGARLRRNKK